MNGTIMGAKGIFLGFLSILAVLAGSTAGAEEEPPIEERPPIQETLSVCRADIQRLCAGVLPGGGRIRACMQERRDELSLECRTAIATAIEQRRHLMRERRSRFWGQGRRDLEPGARPAIVPRNEKPPQRFMDLH